MTLATAINLWLLFDVAVLLIWEYQIRSNKSRGPE